MMELNEARKVVEILRTADGGCKYCAGSLFYEFMEAFPEFVITWEEGRHEGNASDDGEWELWKAFKNVEVQLR